MIMRENAEAGCDKSLACMTRWQSGKPFDASGPEAAIKDQLYDEIRPGAREGIQNCSVSTMDNPLQSTSPQSQPAQECSQ